MALSQMTKTERHVLISGVASMYIDGVDEEDIVSYYVYLGYSAADARKQYDNCAERDRLYNRISSKIGKSDDLRLSVMLGHTKAAVLDKVQLLQIASAFVLEDSIPVDTKLKAMDYISKSMGYYEQRHDGNEIVVRIERQQAVLPNKKPNNPYLTDAEDVQFEEIDGIMRLAPQRSASFINQAIIDGENAE